MPGSRLTPGARVSWIDALGSRRTGTIDEIDKNGNIYVAEARTGTRGNIYLVSHAFTKHEVDRLTVDAKLLASEGGS